MGALLEAHDREPFSNQLELRVVEAPKLPEVGSDEMKAESPLAAWGTFLLAPSKQALMELAKMNPVYEKAKRP